MRLVVPLAGPDFVRSDGSVKATTPLDGEPLLRYVLRSRPWAGDVTEISFVLVDAPETRAFAEGTLSEWFPDASKVFLSTYTRGAALSALAGMGIGQDVGAPIVVDLADILYTSALDPKKAFATAENSGGIALTFPSDKPEYSYLRTDAEGRFVEAAEKRVISANASAGTYIFNNASTYLRAVAHALENEDTQTYRSLFFVCPLFNGVRAQGKSVLLEPVSDVTDIKMAPSNA